MQLLLGFFFFSVLLTTGSALSCEQCTSQTLECSGTKQKCDFDNAVCMTLSTEMNVGSQKVQSTVKNCSLKETCKRYEDLKGKTTTTQTATVPAGAVIKQAICSKAPSSFASFLPAFLGLLLMKLLF